MRFHSFTTRLPYVSTHLPLVYPFSVTVICSYGILAYRQIFFGKLKKGFELVNRSFTLRKIFFVATNTFLHFDTVKL